MLTYYDFIIKVVNNCICEGFDYYIVTHSVVSAALVKVAVPNRTARADFYPHNMRERQVHPFFLSLPESLRQLQLPLETYRNVDASEPGTVIQWNMDALQYRKLLNYSHARLPSVLDERFETCNTFIFLLHFIFSITVNGLLPKSNAKNMSFTNIITK